MTGDGTQIGGTILRMVLLEDVVSVEAEAIPSDDYGVTDTWNYNEVSDYWSHYDQNGDYWEEDNPYDYHNIDPPYEDAEVDMTVVNSISTGVGIQLSIWDLAIGITEIVEDLSIAQLKVLSKFGGIVGGASGILNLVSAGQI